MFDLQLVSLLMKLTTQSIIHCNSYCFAACISDCSL